MKRLKQEIYFPIIIGIHLLFWAIDLYFYKGNVQEINSDTLFFGYLNNIPYTNWHRIVGEVFSSWVVTVFAFNFLMSTRAKLVEKLFGGLDKMYFIHRRSGKIIIFLLLGHFLFVPRAAEFSVGKPLGFYALILIILGVLISVVPFFKKKLPYNKWLNIHKLMGLFYVLAVVHAITVPSLTKLLPITRVYVFGMAFFGIVAWVYRAFLYNIFNTKVDYTVNNVVDLGHQLSEITLNPINEKLNFQAGQFAYFTFPDISKREQHPFTISSSPNEKNLRITVKGLGDYTDNLVQKLSINSTAKVEGPYGMFTQVNIKETNQIWIGGGIGITPFLSLSKEKSNKKVTLYWCVNNTDEAVYAKELEESANKNMNFEVSIWASKERGRFSIDKIDVADFSSTAFLICGPEPLKQSIIKQLKQHKVKSSQIHDEEFAFR